MNNKEIIGIEKKINALKQTNKELEEDYIVNVQKLEKIIEKNKKYIN